MLLLVLEENIPNKNAYPVPFLLPSGGDGLRKLDYSFTLCRNEGQTSRKKEKQEDALLKTAV